MGVCVCRRKICVYVYIYIHTTIDITYIYINIYIYKYMPAQFLLPRLPAQFYCQGSLGWWLFAARLSRAHSLQNSPLPAISSLSHFRHFDLVELRVRGSQNELR